MNIRLKFFLPLALLPLLSGCLEFERQTMSYRHDPSKDTLYIFQDYQGIFGGNDPDKLTQQEKDQLLSVMQGGRTFFFNNWITEFHRAQLEETLAEPAGEIEDDPAYETAIRQTAQLLLANVEIKNLGFYFDDNKRLCGAQTVTVNNISKIVAALNNLLPFILNDEIEDKEEGSPDRNAFTLFRQSGLSFLTLNGSQIVIRYPLPRTEYETEIRDSDWGKAFTSSSGSLQYTNNSTVVLTIGQPENKTTTLSLPFSGKPYAANAIEDANSYGIKDAFDADSAAREFLGLNPPHSNIER